jgi:Flp pilus assembly CpaE family ATPase
MLEYELEPTSNYIFTFQFKLKISNQFKININLYQSIFNQPNNWTPSVSQLLSKGELK